MPLTNVYMRAGKTEAYRQAILDALYIAMRTTFDVPDDDQFMTITECQPASFRYGKFYLGVVRDDDLLLIQITASNTRAAQQKKALYRKIAQLLSESPGVRPENVFVSLVEVAKENWSFGHGLAQYA
jgi:phenylpyruvate tautomerase PptA (4-oxalocrotonate tautomerase family)